MVMVVCAEAGAPSESVTEAVRVCVPSLSVSEREAKVPRLPSRLELQCT
jgi:hypothetical protein